MNNIATGWKNVVFKDEDIEAMASERMKVCNDCRFNKYNACTKCGCPLISATRSPDHECPLGKWTDKNKHGLKDVMT